jgi:hypothetical protein
LKESGFASGSGSGRQEGCHRRSVGACPRRHAHDAGGEGDRCLAHLTVLRRLRTTRPCRRLAPAPFLVDAWRQDGTRWSGACHLCSGGAHQLPWCRRRRGCYSCPSDHACEAKLSSPLAENSTSQVCPKCGWHAGSSRANFLPSRAENGSEKMAANGVRHRTPS